MPPKLTSGTSADRFVALAAEWIEDGRRLDMQGLADESGVSRVTLFRHVGGREALLEKALWRLTEQMLADAAAAWEAERPEGELHTPGTGRHINAIVSRHKGLRRLLDDEPALTLRVLTDPRGRVQTGVVAFVEALLRRDIAEFGLVTLIEPNTLAYALVRLGESFLYADVLAARPPDVATADRLQQALVGRPAAAVPAAPTGPAIRSVRPAADREPSDGRTARSHRTRRAIIDAMRALHSEGVLRPAAPRIAERAGVSVRTVWQQFTDMETLLVAAIDRDNEILSSLLERIDPDLPLTDRVAAFVAQRSHVLEQMTPTWRAARLQEPFSDALRRNKARTLAAARDDLAATFAPELSQLTVEKREQVLDSLHTVSIWSFWESLRVDLGLSAGSARDRFAVTFAALLAEAGFR